MNDTVVNLMTMETGTSIVGFVVVATMVASAVVRGLHSARGY